MDDSKIIDLYWNRSEKAISETDAKYGNYCFSIAYNILTNEQDAEESVSDTYWAAWNQIPPKRPQWLSVFLGKITRNISINCYKTRTACKRGSGEIALALEELEECIPGPCNLDQELETKELEEKIRCFLQTLSETNRIIFLKRYWALESIPEIAAEMCISLPKVKSCLHRTRVKLGHYFQEEGYYDCT